MQEYDDGCPAEQRKMKDHIVFNSNESYEDDGFLEYGEDILQLLDLSFLESPKAKPSGVPPQQERPIPSPDRAIPQNLHTNDLIFTQCQFARQGAHFNLPEQGFCKQGAEQCFLPLSSASVVPVTSVDHILRDQPVLPPVATFTPAPLPWPTKLMEDMYANVNLSRIDEGFPAEQKMAYAAFPMEPQGQAYEWDSAMQFDQRSIDASMRRRRRRRTPSLIDMAAKQQTRKECPMQQPTEQVEAAHANGNACEIPITGSTENSPARFCHSCGGKLKGHYKFCLFCGVGIAVTV